MDPSIYRALVPAVELTLPLDQVLQQEPGILHQFSHPTFQTEEYQVLEIDNYVTKYHAMRLHF